MKDSTSKKQLPERTLKRYRIKQVLKHISPENKNSAILLLQHITDYDLLKWNDKGVIKYKNIIIPNSNIVSLVKHALSKDNRNPVGVKEFYTMLNDIDIPEYLVKNKDILNKYSVDKKYSNVNAWRPPGDLAKVK